MAPHNLRGILQTPNGSSSKSRCIGVGHMAVSVNYGFSSWVSVQDEPLECVLGPLTFGNLHLYVAHMRLCKIVVLRLANLCTQSWSLVRTS